VGSQFFNLQSSDNDIKLIDWRNVEFKNIYARAKITSDKTMPLFFDSEVNDKKFYNIGNVNFENIKITDTTYEGGFGLFRLLSPKIMIINMTVSDVGLRKNFLKTYNLLKNLPSFSEIPQ
jgi:hypothetical protein